MADRVAMFFAFLISLQSVEVRRREADVGKLGNLAEQGVEHRSRARVSAVAPPVRLRCARTERSDARTATPATGHKSQPNTNRSYQRRSEVRRRKKLKKLKMRSELHL